MKCLFCQIAAHKIPTEVIFENKRLMVIFDINPKAKSHLLIFPKEHLSDSVDDLKDEKILEEVFAACRQLAMQYGIHKTGYRIITNHGNDAGQSVSHLHFHLLGGERLSDS